MSARVNTPGDRSGGHAGSQSSGEPGGQPEGQGIRRFGGQLGRQLVDHLPAVAVVLVSCLLLHAVKRLGLFDANDPAWQLPLAAALVLLVSPVRMRRLAPACTITLRTIIVLFTVYAVAARPVVSDVYLETSAFNALFLTHGQWVALLGGVIGWWRPAFALLPILYVTWKKHLLAQLFGFPLNATDYYPVAELGVFLVLGVAVVALTGRVLRARGAATTADGYRLSEVLFIAALATHFANYFYSAVIKALLPGAGPLTWVLENQTHYIMMSAASVGLGPLLSHPTLAWLGHSFISDSYIVSNALVFTAQLLAVVAVLHVRWALVMTLFYDLVHLMIFVTTSILFWKWMVLNLGLVWALGAMRPRRTLPWPLALMGVGVLVLSPLIFKTAALGWFDTAANNRPRVEAVLENGNTVAVPTNYFLEASAELAKSRIGQPFAGHFDDIGAFSKARLGYEQMRRANACELPTAEVSGLAESFVRQPELETFFHAHHAFIVQNVDENGHYPYNWFPHHNWSNPSQYREFAAIDLRRIVAYRYSIDSICLSYDGKGGIDEELKLSGSHVIRVDR